MSLVFENALIPSEDQQVLRVPYRDISCSLLLLPLTSNQWHYKKLKDLRYLFICYPFDYFVKQKLYTK